MWKQTVIACVALGCRAVEPPPPATETPLPAPRASSSVSLETTFLRYGERAERMAAIEAGHVAQNILLQAAARRLAATPLALFDEKVIREALVLPSDHLPIHILAVGQPL